MMDIQELVESGRAKIEQVKREAEEEHQRRLAQDRAEMEREASKFWEVARAALEPVLGYIKVGGGLSPSSWSHWVTVRVPRTVEFRAWFNLVRPWCNAPREACIWKLGKFHLPRARLESGSNECTDCPTPWSVDIDYGYADEESQLDVALARAIALEEERAQLEQEAEQRNLELTAQRAAQELQEQKRMAAQRAAFYPFVYYRVRYGIIADEDGDKYVDTREFDSLMFRESVGGYWTTISGCEIKLSHLVSVERIVCQDADDLPLWCPKIETEWGKIRVLPSGAMRV